MTLRRLSQFGYGVVVCAMAGALNAQSAEIADVTIRRVDACNTTGCRQIAAVVDVRDATGQAINFSDPLEDHFSICERAEDHTCTTAEFDVTRIGDKPITVALVLDRSASMRGDKLEAAKAAATLFVDELRPNDRAAVFAFGSICWLLQPFTDNKEDLKGAIGGIRAGGSTALYDCICQALDLTAPEPGDAKVVVALTDGMENESGTCVVPQSTEPWTPVCEKSQLLAIPVITLGFGEDDSVDERELQAIAECSGGEFLPTPTAEQIMDFYATLVARLGNQYLVQYCSVCFPGVSGTVDLEICAGERLTPCSDSQICGVATYELRRPPVISLTEGTRQLEASRQPANQPLTLCASITADASIEDARIFFRTSGSESYEDRPLVPMDGDTWCFTVPADRVAPPGIDYFLSAFDGICTSTDPAIMEIERPHQVAIEPKERPMLAYVPLTDYCAGEALNIEATATSETAVLTRVEVFYRRTGRIGFDSASLVRVGETARWSGEIPATGGAAPGVEYYVLACDDSELCDMVGSPEAPLSVEPVTCNMFRRCDSNGDGRMDVADGVWTISSLFRDGPPSTCASASDCDADGVVGLTDAIFAIDYRLRGGPRPSAPFPDCGLGASATPGCEAYHQCAR